MRGLCGKRLQPGDPISVAEMGERCDRCFNEELAQRLGVACEDSSIAPMVVTGVDGVRHRFEIRSMLAGAGHALYAREIGQREARGGYQFAILGDRDANAQHLLARLRERIRHGLSVRHVQETEQEWQLTPPSSRWRS